MTEEDICKILAEELQKAIHDEILGVLTSSDPKLVFRRTNDPCVLEYGMDHGHGSFTPTGMRDYHVEPVAKWCNDNMCGIVHTYPHHIVFKNEGEVAWFLLRWS